jgi:hypothetical protein
MVVPGGGSLLTPDAQQGLIQHVRSNPIVQRYLARSSAGGNRFRLTSPSDVLGEREILALNLSLGPSKFKRLYHFPSASSEDIEKYGSEVAHAGICIGMVKELLRAECFLWKHKPREGALAMKLPDHVFGREGWPFPSMWWTFETNLGTTYKPTPGFADELDVTGFLLFKKGEGVQMVVFLTDAYGAKNPQQYVSARFHPYGQKLTAGASEAESDWLGVLKMIAFLNSDYISKDPVRLARSERRELLKVGRDEDAEEAVRVVTLRQPKNNGKPGEVGDGRDWSSRWWVRGHCRAQWCPSTKSHKLIWIAPYLKGPEDKPIVQRIYAVAQ